jgi:uncharacterized membrane protein YoaK (UPF0700 family)
MKSESRLVLTLLVALPLALFVVGLLALAVCSKRHAAASPSTSPLPESHKPTVDVITANSTYVPTNESSQIWSMLPDSVATW